MNTEWGRNLARLTGIVLLLCLLWAGCGTQGDETQATKCLQTTDFDEVPICLPALEALVPCGDHPLIDSSLDLGQVEGVVRLGFYLSPRDLENIGPDLILEDPYLHVTGKRPKSATLLKATDLVYLDGLVSQDAIDKRWEPAKEKYDAVRGSMEWGKMVLLDKYQPRASALTSVVGLDLGEGYIHPIQITFITHLIVRNRLCQVFYYVPYLAESSLASGKAANDEILKTFMEANPPIQL